MGRRGDSICSFGVSDGAFWQFEMFVESRASAKVRKWTIQSRTHLVFHSEHFHASDRAPYKRQSPSLASMLLHLKGQK